MAYDDRDDEDIDDLDIRQPREEIPTYLGTAIAVTLCCCMPFGIVAIVNASQVSTHLARGDYGQAMEAPARAKQWCLIGAILGLANVLVMFAFVAATGL